MKHSERFYLLMTTSSRLDEVFYPAVGILRKVTTWSAVAVNYEGGIGYEHPTLKWARKKGYVQLTRKGNHNKYITFVELTPKGRKFVMKRMNKVGDVLGSYRPYNHGYWTINV